VSTDLLSGLRDRLRPMLDFAAESYRERVPAGYPVIVDAVEQGVVGLELDPSYALYFTTDGTELFAEVYRRSPRTDSRSSSSRQKQAGLPLHDRRTLPAGISDRALRNLIAELMHHWNVQPGIIHISDS
jgi:hypothetical protein